MKLNLAMFREWGRQGGLVGGRIRAARLTKARRRQIAKNAVSQREANKLANGKPKR